MTTNGLSLNDLQDIVEPSMVSAWPPAPGTSMLLAVITIAVGLWCFRIIKKYRSNAYRRAALLELGDAGTSAEIAAILRRTALVAYPRNTVVELQGPAWFQWLEKESGTPLPDHVKSALSSIYSDESTELDALRAYTGEWVCKHAGI